MSIISRSAPLPRQCDPSRAEDCERIRLAFYSDHKLKSSARFAQCLLLATSVVQRADHRLSIAVMMMGEGYLSRQAGQDWLRLVLLRLVRHLPSRTGDRVPTVHPGRCCISLNRT